MSPQPTARIIVLQNPGQDRITDLAMYSRTLHVGRYDPKGETNPELAFDEDRMISRSHAVLRVQGEEWYIEDERSTHGTFVNREPIQGRGRVPLKPGVIVTMGRTQWTLVPGSWIFIRQGDLFVFGPCVNVINYAALHCRLPLFGPLTARNLGTEATDPLVLRMVVKDFSEAAEIKVPSLKPRSQLNLGMMNPTFKVEELRNRVESVHSLLSIRCRESGRILQEKEIAILGFWDWFHQLPVRKSIAAFVSPRNSRVEEVVDRSVAHLQQETGINTYPELLRTSDDQVERIVLHALYDTLLEEYEIRWRPPEMKTCPNSDATYQTVLPPHRVLSDKQQRKGQANCLDLAVFVSACLEKIGLCPIILFIHEPNGEPRHALPGCWAGSVPGDRPVITDMAFLLRELDEGRLLVAEFTGVTSGAGKRLDFEEALLKADDQLKRVDDACLVDIKPLRPPLGAITPIESPTEPEVGRAYDLAKRLARDKRRELIETVHLFYGLFAVRGEVVSAMCDEAGIDPGALCEKIASLVKPRKYDGTPVPTISYTECCRLAADLGWHAGVPSVREQDLLWALLQKGAKSRKMQEVCRKLGLHLTRLGDMLSKHHPCPITPFSSFSYSRSEE